MLRDRIELPTVGRFVVLEPGVFVMGNERPVTDWNGVMRPEHARNGPERNAQVTKPFAILDTPVTVSAFRAAGIAAPTDAEVFTLPASRTITDRWSQCPFWGVNTSQSAPIVGVTWDEATLFCAAISRRFGLVVRLPTETEWEYGCRAGTSSLYFWGDDLRDGGDHAWFDENSGMRVHDVREKLANPWGLFDMAGNVWEWCAPSSTEAQPLMPVRGGSACHHATSGRSAHHFGQPREQRNAFLGFRCVLEVEL